MSDGYVKLTWKGDHIRSQLEKATVEGIDEITERCVADAKSNHPYASRTGTAEAAIQKKPAKATASKISGRWGYYGGRKIRYGFYLEVGTAKMGAFPTLRPAAEANYPDLTGIIARKANM